MIHAIGRPWVPLFALADDLSGAAEVAAALMSPARPARIALSGPYASFSDPVLVADLDCRHHPRAAELVREALAQAGDRRIFVKIDSLLRGDVAATVSAVSAVSGPVVFASALPAAGRTVVGGVPYVNGVPLRETRAWHIEPRPAPASVAAALDGLTVTHVPLATVRADHRGLTAAIGRASGVAVCDAETDRDLDAIVAAAFAADPRTRLIGAGGLATAFGRTFAAVLGRTFPNDPPAPSSLSSFETSPLLVVVGTAAPSAAAQAALLIDHGAHHISLTTADLDIPEATARRLRAALTTGPTVLTVAEASLTDALARLVARALDGSPARLILTGGETARRVLEALDVRELIPVGQVHHGAVHSRTPQGHSVVTRPGSFGDRDSLLRMAAHLAPFDERLT
ncbi:4-hydroxythreonine-4-phosphate dehydrogenase [Nonomuraea solani]|uniref:4-hydroxythreonine-4-phosphate dehydrogenase n=1 Tax=Nonomuraea solani TaxID=1144553 RepID=A0A1H5YFN7_9ACTN|nr:four-carbon acid sugar kinase family protein [Nonomuraea solani]SEG22881.1 4-hydroxythreonine-4-phosphate dehydrogenase [Nonomuraea solani]